MAKHTSKKTRTRKHIKNSHLLESMSYLGNNSIPTVIQHIQYSPKQVSSEIVDSIRLKSDTDESTVHWYKVIGIADVQQIMSLCKGLGIQRYDIKDMLSGQQVSKVIEYEKVTFILTSSCFLNAENQLEVGQIGLVLGENFLVTFQESPYPIFDEVEEAIKASRVQIREKKADFLLYILLRCVHSMYSESIINLSRQINEVEDILIERKSTEMNVMEFIQSKRVEYGVVKRCISPMRDEFINLLYNTRKLISAENIIYFNDYDDRLRTSAEELEIFRDSLRSLMDLFFNNNNLRMNEIMKRLTVVSTIFIPLTFMVGVWGMNFDIMPELKWKYGYALSWGVMLVIALIAAFFLKKKKWL